ncbi:MAG: type II secretion system F family protein [Proteobacteria bacterium]|nr:type II secretion system F family protein [Pseudomonadota bacterium]MBU1583763.1 type II secretion system F family protein [Pseudomonadota bacterium]MBU2630230.1 type II secretion system F family protein [Pseudomonadota bacterium]
MTIFKYTAINENGNDISGDVEADTEELALEILSSRGHIPESVREKTGAASGNSNFLTRLTENMTPVKPRDIILFTKQFKTLIQAGVSMIQILSIIEAQTENKRLQKIIIQISDDIKEGASLFTAFIKHEKIFSPLYCSMIKAGESSGALPDVLDRLIYIIEHEHKVKSEIKAAMRYPIIVVCFLGVAFFVLLTFVIPKFITIFERAGIELPLPTKICMSLYSIIHNYWLVMLISILVTIIALVKIFQTQKGKYIRDRALMKIPLVGHLIVKSAMSRFASIFSILQASGVTVLESMDILSETISNAAITREFAKVRELLTEGRGISQPLRQAKYFTPMVINMVAIGEESGNLDGMLQEIAVHYDSEVEYSTKGLSEAVGPILTIGLAAVVGFFALAIFLPMWDLTKMVH